MRTLIYCRVSTVEQAQNLSLETQETACRAYCAREGYDVDEVFVDAGESAKTADRPADGSDPREQFDNDVRSARTVVGMKAALQKGRWCWQPPIGYSVGAGPSLVPNPDVAPLVRRAFELADAASAAPRSSLVSRGSDCASVVASHVFQP